MALPYQIEQLQFIVDLAKYRSAYLNPLFQLLHYVDSMYFVFILVPLIWIGFSYRWGIRLYYLLLVSLLLNTVVKNYFGWSRPCTDLAELGLYSLNSFGFPSGGAQGAVLLGGLIAYYWKSKYAVPLGVLYALLISFSRMYLGVHYPIDVLGGWVIGFALLAAFINLVDPLEQFLAKKGLWVSLLISELLPIGLALSTTQVAYHRYDAMGIGLGIFLSLKYSLYLPAPQKITVGIARGLIAMTGVFVLFFSLQFLSLYASVGIISLWLSLFASPFCKWVLGSELFRREFPA